MAGDLDCKEIVRRSRRIRLPVNALAGAAEVHHDTAHRYLRGAQSILPRNRRALERALVAEELALRDHLLALHPLPGSRRAAPAPTPLEDYLSRQPVPAVAAE